MIKIAPSILTADFADLGSVIRRLEAAGADYLHMDVMDGVFVPNISFGPALIKSVHNITKLPLDVHLMINTPDRYIEDYAEAGASIITVHAECASAVHMHRMLSRIRSLGIKTGVAINPATSHSVLDYVYELADLILVMSVNPGFGGQSFIPSTLRKLEQIAADIWRHGFNIELEVDGGVNESTAREVINAGANVLVAGSAVLNNDDYKAAIDGLRNRK